jgi:hypothetical protein
VRRVNVAWPVPFPLSLAPLLANPLVDPLQDASSHFRGFLLSSVGYSHSMVAGGLEVTS